MSHGRTKGVGITGINIKETKNHIKVMLVVSSWGLVLSPLFVLLSI